MTPIQAVFAMPLVNATCLSDACWCKCRFL